MKAYKYKNIRVYQTFGRWSADYITENGKRFALHVACTATKADAIQEAKTIVDYLNSKQEVNA